MSEQNKINILVVDDLPEKLLVFESILEELNEHVITARSGEEALRCVLDRDFAVILLDVNMPGMDGLETASYIRTRKRSALTPIIFVTAYADDVHTARGYSLGAVDYILSPVMPEVLRTKVKVFVDLFRMHEQMQQQAEERVIMARAQADERVAMAKAHAARVAAEESNRRLAFLAQSSGKLSRSLDIDETLSALTSVVIPFLADHSALVLSDERMERQTWLSGGEMGTGGDSAPGGDTAIKLRSLPGISLELLAPLQNVVERTLQSGESALLTAENLRLAAQGNGSGSAAARTAVRDTSEASVHRRSVSTLDSAIVVPLLARGRILGALALARITSGEEYGPADLALAEELAARAAVAIDNARLYRSLRDADHQKDEFLAMLAHELRNPLAPICNALEILRLGKLEHPDLTWSRSIIERQVRHLVRLVDDLLDVSRITRGKIALQKQVVDVAAIVATADEASRPHIASRQHELSISLPSFPLQVEADPDRLCQVLNNLLNNAAKYTEPGGRIWLTVTPENSDVVFRVRDTGIGIDADMLPRVFDLFTQGEQSLDRRSGGLGLGLPLVRKLVEMHGGSVTGFSDGKGRGSEFVVRLPLPVAKETPLNRLVENEAERGFGVLSRGDTPSHRILVVDDHEDVADCLAMLLQGLGHVVWTVHDGHSAFEAVRTLEPEVVLLDIGLPEMDGYEVARRLRQEHGRKDLKLIAITGYGQEADRRRTEEAGFDDHLLKPAGCDELSRLLAQTPPTKCRAASGQQSAVSN